LGALYSRKKIKNDNKELYLGALYSRKKIKNVFLGKQKNESMETDI
jgi:hypothetical protein